jgi:hypothetical protein
MASNDDHFVTTRRIHATPDEITEVLSYAWPCVSNLRAVRRAGRLRG